jgi:hypothetical protein
MINYWLIGNIVTVIIAVAAFLEAGIKGKIFLVLIFSVLVVLPHISTIEAMDNICFFGRIIVAIGCYVFIKWRGLPIK